jgi:integration host factor subunit beta
MTKAELVDTVSKVSDLTRKHSEVIVEAVFTSIIEALQRGDKIELRGFGSLPDPQARQPRPGATRRRGRAWSCPPSASRTSSPARSSGN